MKFNVEKCKVMHSEKLNPNFISPLQMGLKAGQILRSVTAYWPHFYLAGRLGIPLANEKNRGTHYEADLSGDFVRHGRAAISRLPQVKE